MGGPVNFYIKKIRLDDFLPSIDNSNDYIGYQMDSLNYKFTIVAIKSNDYLVIIIRYLKHF